MRLRRRPARRDAAVSLAAIASVSVDYERLGVPKGSVASFEDGARTDGRRGTYEWWYLDAHLADGSTLAVVFMNKDPAQPERSVAPVIRVTLNLADGRIFQKVARFDAKVWSASTDHADVRIADHRFCGDLRRYHVRARVEDVEVDVTLNAKVPAWRPGTGYICFGVQRDRHLGWIAAVPDGTVDASYRIRDRTYTTSGTGYHDHNWGNVALRKIVNDWHWARGRAGPYAVIAAHISANKRYGHAPVPIFMLAKNGHVVADDARHVRFERRDCYTDSFTGRPAPRVTRYRYEADADTYVVALTRHGDLTRSRLIDELHGLQKVAAKLIGFDGAYLRFTGELRIQRLAGDDVVEDYSGEAIWDVCWLGRAAALPSCPRPEAATRP
jgi:predicted secreted hydrolase